jgi:hypothetical protein
MRGRDDSERHLGVRIGNGWPWPHPKTRRRSAAVSRGGRSRTTSVRRHFKTFKRVSTLVDWSVVADSRWRVDDTPFRQQPEVRPLWGDR